MHPNVAGALIYGALFIIGVFVLGIATAHYGASVLALYAAALAFFSHVLQMLPKANRAVVWSAIVLSWVAAWAALFALYGNH